MTTTWISRGAAACTLPEGELLLLEPVLDHRHDWQLIVETGAIWVTWPGCLDDHFLGAGDRLVLPSKQKALIEVEPRLQRGAALLRLAKLPHVPKAIDLVLDLEAK